jgi:hypothetical protein
LFQSSQAELSAFVKVTPLASSSSFAFSILSTDLFWSGYQTHIELIECKSGQDESLVSVVSERLVRIQRFWHQLPNLQERGAFTVHVVHYDLTWFGCSSGVWLHVRMQ